MLTHNGDFDLAPILIHNDSLRTLPTINSFKSAVETERGILVEDPAVNGQSHKLAAPYKDAPRPCILANQCCLFSVYVCI